MKNIPVKVDGVDSLSGAEFNPNQEELENAVTASDQTLDEGNENQLGEAMGRYGSGGADFYQDSGAVNAYILTGVGSFIKPAVYFDGMSVKFYTANTNTGPSTINVASIGVKDLVLTDGSALVGGEVIAGSLIIATYDLASDKVRLNPIADLSSPPAIGDATPNSIDGTIIKANTRFEGPLGSTNPAAVKATTFEGNAGGTTINEFSTDGTLAGDSDDAVPTEQAVKAAIAGLSVFGNQLLHVQDQKSTGTNGGTFTSGAEQTRDLNTVLTNEITGASLSSNQITLPAGTYYIDASAPSFNVGTDRAKLRDITGGADLLTGTSEGTFGFTGPQVRSFISGRFTLSVASLLEIQHRGSVTQGTSGFGVSGNFGPHEVYTDVKIWKVG